MKNTKKLIRSLLDEIEVAKDRVNDCEREYIRASSAHNRLLNQTDDGERLAKTHARCNEAVRRWTDASDLLDDLQTKLDLLLS